MVFKKHDSSVVNWDEENHSGVFKVTSNRGRSARGFVRKSRDGNLVALIESTDYANSYALRKVLSTLKAIFKDQPETIVLQRVIDCSPGYIYTDSNEAEGLSPNDPHTISGSYIHYCQNGAFDCGGKTYQGPVSVTYTGSVIGVCAGMAVEYSKFKIKQ